LPLFDAGGEAGEILADAQDPGLDHRDHRGRQFDPGLGDQGLDQQQQQLAEAVRYRGKGGSVVHTPFLLPMPVAGQGENDAFRLFFLLRWSIRKKEGYPQMTQIDTDDEGGMTVARRDRVARGGGRAKPRDERSR
jgi:hypothetical protein